MGKTLKGEKMKATGIVRRIDELGRVVIPKEIRRTLRIKEGDPLEIYTDRDELLFKKYSPLLSLDRFAESFTKSLNCVSEKTAIICDTDTVVSATGSGSRDLIGKIISADIEKIIKEKKTVITDEGTDNAYPVTKGEGTLFASQIIVPIICNGDCLGVVILADKTKAGSVTPADIKLTQMSAELIGNQLS